MTELVLRHLHMVLERKTSHATCGGSSFIETQTLRFLNDVCKYDTFVQLETTDSILIYLLRFYPNYQINLLHFRRAGKITKNDY
jgi:hypothetical protein